VQHPSRSVSDSLAMFAPGHLSPQSRSATWSAAGWPSLAPSTRAQKTRSTDRRRSEGLCRGIHPGTSLGQPSVTRPPGRQSPESQPTLKRTSASVGQRDLLGERSDGGGRIRVYGCSPGCLIVSLLLSLFLTLVINLLIRAF
jgi:hypothetical protein